MLSLSISTPSRGDTISELTAKHAERHVVKSNTCTARAPDRAAHYFARATYLSTLSARISDALWAASFWISPRLWLSRPQSYAWCQQFLLLGSYIETTARSLRGGEKVSIEKISWINHNIGVRSQFFKKENKKYLSQAHELFISSKILIKQFEEISTFFHVKRWLHLRIFMKSCIKISIPEPSKTYSFQVCVVLSG